MGYRHNDDLFDLHRDMISHTAFSFHSFVALWHQGEGGDSV